MSKDSNPLPIALTLAARESEGFDPTIAAPLDAGSSLLLPTERLGLIREPAGPPAEYGQSPLQDELVEARLKAPKMRTFSPATAIVQRHCRRESSLEETLLEIYYANISVCKAEEIAQALWGNRLGPSTLSAISRKIIHRITTWLRRPLRGDYAYLFVDSIQVRQKRGRENKFISVLLAVGVNARGGRDVLGVAETAEGTEVLWPAFVRQLKERGLTGVKLCVGGYSPDLIKSTAEFFPDAVYQGCVMQMQRDVLSLVPSSQVYVVLEILRFIHSAKRQEEARMRLLRAVAQLQKMNLPEAAALLRQRGRLTFGYYSFPPAHWRRLSTTEPLNKVLREFRERLRAIGSISEDNAAALMASARLRYVARTAWGRQWIDLTKSKPSEG